MQVLMDPPTATIAFLYISHKASENRDGILKRTEGPSVQKLPFEVTQKPWYHRNIKGVFPANTETALKVLWNNFL